MVEITIKDIEKVFEELFGINFGEATSCERITKWLRMQTAIQGICSGYDNSSPRAQRELADTYFMMVLEASRQGRKYVAAAAEEPVVPGCCDYATVKADLELLEARLAILQRLPPKPLYAERVLKGLPH
jgi:hypothetical protein